MGPLELKREEGGRGAGVGAGVGTAKVTCKLYPRLRNYPLKGVSAWIMDCAILIASVSNHAI